VREYEVTVILKPDIEEAVRTELIGSLERLLTHGEGEGSAPATTHWGQRQLAYPIKNFRDGYYVFFEALMEPKRIPDVERNIQFNDEILRHLVVRKES